MILENHTIGTYKVGTVLETNSRDYGTLCTHPNINMWSKWKPIRSDAETMTLAELVDKRYGLKVIETSTIEALIEAIDANQGIGVYYERPLDGQYRIGDFRNYNSEAPRTVETTEEYYRTSYDGVVKIGGVTTDNHGSYEIEMTGTEAPRTDTTIGVADLYHFNEGGKDIVVRRGAYITDGTNSIWYSDKFYWWTPEMQKFGGKTVTVYEFFTNVEMTADHRPQSSSTDRFYALPIPKYTLQVKTSSPAGSKVVGLLTSCMMRDSTYQFIDCKLQFTAVDDIYRGNAKIKDINVSLYWDKEGKGEAVDSWKPTESVFVPKGGNAPIPPLTHVFRNRPQGINGPLQPLLYFRVFGSIDGNPSKLIGGAQVMMDSGGREEYILRK